MVTVGCVSEEARLRSNELYEEGVRYYLAGQYDQGAGRLSQAASATDDSALRARASLFEGRCYLGLAQFHQAEQAFRRGLSAGGAPAEAKAGLEVGLADSLYGEERYREAADQYRRALQKHRDLVPADEATFKLALAYQRDGLWEAARREFAQLALHFPQSPRAEAAREYARSESRAFAVQCGAFSSAASADRLAGELRAQGFTPRTVPVTTPDGRTLSAVRVGKFRTWAEAVPMRSRLRAAGFEARITP